MYLFVVLCQDCLVNEVIERFSLCLIERIREGITFTLDLGNGPSWKVSFKYGHFTPMKTAPDIQILGGWAGTEEQEISHLAQK